MNSVLFGLFVMQEIQRSQFTIALAQSAVPSPVLGLIVPFEVVKPHSENHKQAL